MYLRITWTIEKSNSFVQFILHLVESTNIYSVRYICVMDMLQVIYVSVGYRELKL